MDPFLFSFLFTGGVHQPARDRQDPPAGGGRDRIRVQSRRHDGRQGIGILRSLQSESRAEGIEEGEEKDPRELPGGGLICVRAVYVALGFRDWV